MATGATLDLHFIETVLHPTTRQALPRAADGDAFLAGGTWLFSETQPALRRLIDLRSLDWPPLSVLPDGALEIAATCRFAELEMFAARSGWPTAGLFGQCCNALWGSFKIRNTATIGGNLCLALPAAPMAALMTALDAECRIWNPNGGERLVQARGFITGAGRNALDAGEVLRAIRLPQASLHRDCAFRQASLTRFGRSAALLIGTRNAAGSGMTLTITAAVRTPVRLEFPAAPSADALAAGLAAVLTPSALHDDVHGAADWKRHMACLRAEQIRQELAA